MDAKISPKRALFVLLALLTLTAFIVHNLPMLTQANPEWAHVAPFRWWLLLHAPFAATALVLGPLQFSSTIRRRNLQLHRRIGQTYVGAVTVASISGIVIGFHLDWGATQVAVQGGVWLIVTLMAWIAARSHNVAQHRMWVGRSYGLTFVFVTAREKQVRYQPRGHKDKSQAIAASHPHAVLRHVMAPRRDPGHQGDDQPDASLHRHLGGAPVQMEAYDNSRNRRDGHGPDIGLADPSMQLQVAAADGGGKLQRPQHQGGGGEWRVQQQPPAERRDMRPFGVGLRQHRQVVDNECGQGEQRQQYKQRALGRYFGIHQRSSSPVRLCPPRQDQSLSIGMSLTGRRPGNAWRNAKMSARS